MSDFVLSSPVWRCQSSVLISPIVLLCEREVNEILLSIKVQKSRHVVNFESNEFMQSDKMCWNCIVCRFNDDFVQHKQEN